MHTVGLTMTMGTTECVIYRQVTVLPSCCALKELGWLTLEGHVCKISWEIRGDGAERWLVVMAVGLGEIGMKQGEVFVQLLDGQLVGVTFGGGTSLQRTGTPPIIQAIVSRSERGYR